MTHDEAMTAAFEAVAGRRPGCGVPGTPMRRAWVAAHGAELRAELARVTAADRPLTLWEAA